MGPSPRAECAAAPTGLAESMRYYDERFASGYVESWPAWKRSRVRDWIRELPLPERGSALDFGCGNGVFTRVLAEALPGWKVTGCDLSRQALAQARERAPELRFQHLDDVVDGARRFDLVFTHHVLEHVVDLAATLAQIGALLREDGAALHVLPCADPGSLEHDVCRWRRDGFERERGGRFFFEDPGHLRRLESDALVKLCAEQGLALVRRAHACQRAGAVDWITRSGAGFVRRLADPAAAIDRDAARRLRRLRRRLLGVARLRSWAGLRGARRLALLPLYLLGRAVDRRCTARQQREWRECRSRGGGSEMYLFLARHRGGPAC